MSFSFTITCHVYCQKYWLSIILEIELDETENKYEYLWDSSIKILMDLQFVWIKEFWEAIWCLSRSIIFRVDYKKTIINTKTPYSTQVLLNCRHISHCEIWGNWSLNFWRWGDLNPGSESLITRCLTEWATEAPGSHERCVLNIIYMYIIPSKCIHLVWVNNLHCLIGEIWFVSCLQLNANFT